jgi:hypothetical protein
MLFILSLTALAGATPGIVIEGASAYGTLPGKVWGKVTGTTNYSAYKVVVIIKVADEWWVKPYCEPPFTNIRKDGIWEAVITTGGHDDLAEFIMAYLVSSSMSADDVPCRTFCQPGGISGYHDYAVYDRKPSKRVLDFAGSQWRVRKSELPSGPGGNIFSNSASDVWVDGSGMHLTISDKGSHWASTEVIRQGSLGRGVYMIQTASRIDLNDPNSVLGVFTWDPWLCDDAHRELDWEVTKWSDPNNRTNSQYVVQPCGECPGCVGRCVRFPIRLTDHEKHVTTYIIWDKDKVQFRSYRGQFTDLFPPPDFLIKKWTYRQDGIPSPGKENFRLNFWLHNAVPPSDGKRQEVVFSNFAFNKKALMIDTVSKLGSKPGYVQGSVTRGVVPNQYRVEVFIEVDGKWWSKPTFQEPLTSIKSNRTWKTLITTGGHDEDATRIIAFLLPVGKGPHPAGGLSDIPAEAYADAISWDEVIRK